MGRRPRSSVNSTNDQQRLPSESTRNRKRKRTATSNKDRDGDHQDYTYTSLCPPPASNSSSCTYQSISQEQQEQQCPMHEVDRSAFHDDPSIYDESWLPENRILELVLDILQRRDAYEIFAEPVDPSEVEDYYEIIKQPMDFGTMRAKLHEGMYKNLQQFEHDVFLIFDNAMHFNSPTTIYFRQARALEDIAEKVFQVLRAGPENLELEFAETKGRSCRKVNEQRGNRRGRKTYMTEVDKRCTYKPRISLLHEIDSSITPIHHGPLLPAHANHLGYKESLMLFAKDLGQTAQKVVRRKLQGMWKSSVDTDNFWDHRVKCQNSNEQSFFKTEPKQTCGSSSHTKTESFSIGVGKSVEISREGSEEEGREVGNPSTSSAPVSVSNAIWGWRGEFELNRVQSFSVSLSPSYLGGHGDLKKSSGNNDAAHDVLMMPTPPAPPPSRREVGNDIKMRPPQPPPSVSGQFTFSLPLLKYRLSLSQLNESK